MIEMYLDSASTYSGHIDMLIMLIAAMTGFWWAATFGMFLWLAITFREKEGQKSQYITGKEKHLKKWVSRPHVLIIICDIFIIAGAVFVWYEVKQDLSEADAVVRITGQQWAWTFQHPGKDGKLDTDDDIRTVDELHIEVGKVYHYKLESLDVLHSFSVPVFRLKQDAVPGRVITGWFEATKAGKYDIQCAEICGIGHGMMVATIYLETPEEHAKWVASTTPNP